MVTTSITVWILVGYMQANGMIVQSGGPLIVDNIASAKECESLKARISQMTGAFSNRFECIRVEKVKP